MQNAVRKTDGTVDISRLSGREKVAIVLMAAGEEASAEITKHLPEEEVEAISFEIARMDKVDPAVVEAIIEEWKHTEAAAFSLAQGGVDYARKILEKAFGQNRAKTILQRIESQLHDSVSLAPLRSADPDQLMGTLRKEHPQTIALVLAYLNPDQTAHILRGLDPDLGSEIVLRMARMDKVMPDALRVVEGTLGSDSDVSLSRDVTTAGGPEIVAEVLNHVASGLERDLLDGVAVEDVELSEEIKDLMFVFEDITGLDDKAITRILRDVETRELALALKVASDELKDRILGSMSNRARDALLEEIDFLGPVRVSDVEKAQAEIVQTARALEEAGEIVIGGSDDMVVE